MWTVAAVGLPVALAAALLVLRPWAGFGDGADGGRAPTAAGRAEHAPPVSARSSTAVGPPSASGAPTPAARPTGTRAGGAAPGPPPGLATFPGPDTTGWRHTGVTLRPFHCTGAVTEITRAGTVVDGMDVGCGLLIRADDVTVSRSRIRADAQIPVRTEDGRTGVRITDVEIVGQPGCIAGIGYMGWTALRVDVHGCGDGVRIENGSTLQDSWIHGFWDGTVDGRQVDTPHHDGAQSTGGSHVTIRHNRIDNPHDQTSCILIGDEFGAPSDILIEGNHLDGGNYSIYLAPTGSNRTVRGNVFTRNHVYGPANVGGQYTWTDNRYTDGAPVVP